MPVVGVLVQAEVGHEHELVADDVAHGAQRDLHDAVRDPTRRSPGRPCAPGTPKRMSPGMPNDTSRLASTTSESSECCTSPGMDAIGIGLLDPLPHEERGDQVVGPETGLGHQAPQRRGAAQPAQPAHGEAPRNGR